MSERRRDLQKHVFAEGGSYRLAIQNIVYHLDMMSDEQKAAINWHSGQSVSLAVMRLIAIDDYRKVGAGSVAKDGRGTEHPQQPVVRRAGKQNTDRSTGDA